MRSQGPPSSFPSGLQPVANDPTGRHLVRRISRTDLDFEQALRGDGTVMLKEGIDMSALGVESPGSVNRSYSSSSHSTPSGTPVNRSISRVPLQPSTPVVVPASPSPPGPSNFSSLSMSSPSVPTRHATAPTVPSQLSASLGPTPASSSHDLVTDVEEAERQTNRRSMYRSPGTSSSPDLATLLRKAKERGGPVPAGATNGGGIGRKDKRRDDHPPPLPDQTVRGQIPNFGNSGDNGRDWASLSPRQHRDATIKAPKSSVRAKTSAFLGKMLGQNTVRERSKTDASLHPSSASQPPPALMNVFAPPVPPIPSEHRSPRYSPNNEGPSSTSRFADSSKPLPPIVRSPSTMREGEDYEDKSIVFVDKVAPLPPLPSSPPVTPVRAPPVSSRTTSANGPKRRSMSVSDAEVRLNLPPVPSPVSPPAVAIPSPAPAPRTPSNRRHESTDHTLHGILDLFKGELSTLDPISGASLDLLDPSSPSRRINHRSKTDGHILSTWEDPQDERGDKQSTPTFNDPFGGRPNLTSEEPPVFTPTIVPPRTSSLASPRNSIGSGIPISPSRPSNTPRSRSGPPTSAFAAQNLSPRAASGLRSLHRSTASSSEPSLIPLSGDARTFPPSRRGSQQELRSPDSLQFATSPTIIGGEDGADLEPRAQDLAMKCWNDNDEFLPKEKIAEWLGGHGSLNRIALRYYIDNFDFTGLRLDMAFRRLCGKLFLKAETQQVDRILEQFSRRYWECNQESIFGSANLVHAVSYSLLLLNTDLHVAELAAHMSKNQFVRNTMTAIQMQTQPDALTRVALNDKDDNSSVRGGSDETEVQTRSKRSDSVTSWSSLGRETGAHFAAASAPNGSSLGVNHPNSSNPSVQSASTSAQDLQNRQFGRAWETDMESLLKEMYNAVKSQQILQPLNSLNRASTSSLSPGGSAMLRNRSLRSQPDRLTTLKRGSIRGLQSILTVQSGISPYSSNSSIDGRVSPSPSFATSTHELYGSSSTFLNPTLGFASNLSHTIIREAQEDDDRSVRSEGSDSTTISISDEELALLGAPWAKEGMLCRKQYWESAGKRAKDKNWMDVFVVIQKGELNMFTFGDHTSGGAGTFGGGNWLANAESVGTIQLAHSLAHALPPPGYHKRPHCMVLTLANRGVYFFQAGTEELVNEWVSTCNYWAARTSKEPLAGGVSNMEYGWNRVADLYGHGRSQSQTDLRKDDTMDTMSVRSGKSTRSKYGWKDGSATVRGGFSPRSDKTFINDWKPPMHPTVASTHDEEAQLDALRKHVETLKKDLETHNELREPMSALYTPRTASAIKSQTNWEEKSQYLLREIVKYDLYIDSLLAGMNLRLKKRGEKALELALNHSDPDNLKKSRKLSGPPDSPIAEESEPTTPITRTSSNKNHRREQAESHDDDDDD
ncbi:hypothetical protein CPB83DRAFT_786238 [Crepidotus variabilis]|uniref:SEC7 domain-containing protein n=1 Tax=Crepidotus variabilis TaxID=179855 RepID=A0A9P6JTA1_9AGAR|nr:hypothetical protein CPB83DRAFT_786238 [Crepidotus variabilis]